MSKTPTKNESGCNFIPKEITTPNKDQTGVSKTVFSHVSRLHGLLNDWVKLRDKGTKFCKVITSIKLHECTDDYYPQQLKPIMENLVDILESMKDVVEGSKQAYGSPDGKSSPHPIEKLKLQSNQDKINNLHDFGVQIINSQLEALAQLQPTSEPVILTWSAGQISKCVKNVCQSLEKEYKLKKVVTENVAHCRDEFLIEVYVSSWELDPYLNIEDNTYLFAEFGLAGVT